MKSQHSFPRTVFFLFLLACLLSGLVGVVRVPVQAAPQFAPSTTVVISQVYGGGGNAGATYTNDFVELFNLGTTSVSLAGWSIQYASATGTGLFSANTTPLSGSIAPGQYYLVQLAGGVNGAPFPVVADATGATAMSATNGKVVLVDTSTGLPCNGGTTPCTATDLTSIVDLVGYGTADFFEGSFAAPALSNTMADIRGSNGCTDTDDNSNDFATGSPSPRNTSSLANICPPPIPEVIISEVAWMGTQASANDEWIELYNAQPTPVDLTGWRLVNTTGSVDVIINGVIPANGFFLLERAHDLTVSDVTANQIYTGALGDINDSLTLSMPNGTIIDTANNDGGVWPAGTGSPDFYSMERVVTGGVPAADTDAGWISSVDSTLWTTHDAAGNLIHGTPGSANWGFTVTATFTPTITPTLTRTPTPTRTPTGLIPAGNIVISEFRVVGPDGGNDEFIELFNPTSSSVAIGGWILSKSSGCGSSVSTITQIGGTVALAPGQHYLLGGSAYSGTVTPDQTYTQSIATSGGIALLDSSNNIIDQVGLCNSTTYHEGTALTQLTSYTNQSYDRKTSSSGACTDSNNNILDFFLRNPSDPQNLSSPLTLCGNPTPSPIPTHTRTPYVYRTSTPRPLPPPPLIGINEFVPRPGHDWNNDGVINTGDEFIELINFGVIDVNLSGYTLDDEANIGSKPYRITSSITLKPGQRMVFYGGQTGLILNDGGDGVRLLKPNGQLADAYNYTVVRYPDESYCRLPDDGGLDDWNENCFPTPGLKNSLNGDFVQVPGGNAPLPDDQASCPFSDTFPQDFALAECPSFGNIWSRYYWDKDGWYGERIIPSGNSEWDSFVN